MSHLLKRTKKSCIKLMRKLSSKQIFLKRLEEEDISTDIDLSVEAKEKDLNQNENVTPKKLVSCYKHKKSDSSKGSHEDVSKETAKRKLTIHFEEVNSEKDVLQSLTSKLFLTADGYEFRRLQQLRSDTASEIVPYDPHFDKSDTEKATLNDVNRADAHDEDKKLEVVFEKVKYKEDVRYLRHTPSTCSLDNYIINEVDEDENDMMMMTTTISNTLTNGHTNTNNKTNSTNNLNCLNADAKDFEYTTRGLEMHNNHFVSAHECPNQDHNHQMQQFVQQQQQQQQSQQLNHLLPVNVSLGCITDGNHHQLFIGQERDYFYKLTPVVKWDINGNSLEDDDFPDFDINANSSPAKSSLRSSSTTLETWLEVE